jgi:hypothetical protein
MEEGEYYSPAFLTRYERKGASLKVEEKGQYSMSLDLVAVE